MRWVVCFRDLLPEEDQFDYLSEQLLRLFLRFFLREGFRHCFAYTEVCTDVYLIVDARSNGMDVCVTNTLPLNEHVYAVAHGLSSFKRGYRPRGIFTCVTAIKHLLGIRACWVVTPHQLYRYLKKRAYV